VVLSFHPQQGLPGFRQMYRNVTQRLQHLKYRR